MEIVESFLILEIEATKDMETIKKAYREKLSVTNPEDDPEGFKRLRAAYDEACAYTKRSREQTTEQERDTSDSGLWLEKAAELYKDFERRKNPDCWKELLNDEIFLSLEEEENCRIKLLQFMMDHFRLPTDVWKLLDSKLHLSQDSKNLREMFPADFINFVVRQCERGEEIEYDLFEGAPDAEYDIFLNYYDECWHALQNKEIEQAEKLLDEADGLHIYHPAIEVCRGEILLAQGKNEEACRFMEQLYGKYPGDTMVAYNTAEAYWSVGNKERAAEIYRAMREENEKHYMANVRLTEWYYECGRYHEAKECAEKVLSTGAEDAFMELLAKINANLEHDLEVKWEENKDWQAALELGWCYLQDGKFSQGIRLAKQFKELVSADKQAEYNGLLAKLFVEQGEYEEAIRMAEVWEESLKVKLTKDETDEEREKDEDRVRQSHMIRVQSYVNLGYKDKQCFDKAIAELETVETGTVKDIGFWLEKSRIYMEMEEYEKSLELVDRLIDEYQIFAAAATAADVYRRQWDAEGVVKYARMCVRYFPDYIRAYELLGKVFMDLNEKQALEELLEEAKQNDIQSVYLEAYRHNLTSKAPAVEVLNRKLEVFQKEFQDKLERGETAYYETGLPIITEYLYWYCGAYMLQKRAAFFRSGMHLREALEDYVKALEDEPADPYIFEHMGQIHLLLGEYEKALVCLKKSLLLCNPDMKGILQYQMARLYATMGDDETALAWFRQYEKESGGKEEGHLKSMAVCLARLGMIGEAVEKLTRYYKKQDGTFYDGYYRSLIEAYRVVDEQGKAREVLEQWKKSVDQSTSRFHIFTSKSKRVSNDEVLDYYCCRGWQELQDGEWESALGHFETQYRLAGNMAGSLKAFRDHKDGLDDIILTSILYGQEKLGKKYAEKLKLWLNRESFRAVNEYHERPKEHLLLEFLANYYTAKDEQLQAIVDRDATCPRCEFCHMMPRCQETETARILLLLKQGRQKEALDRLAENEKIQPYDVYMKSIRRALNAAGKA